MWGCLKGEIDVHRLGVKDLQDLSSVIENYPNTVTSRIKSLKKNGEPSSSLPPLVVPDEAVSFDLKQDHKVEEDVDTFSMDGSHSQSETNHLATITTTVVDVCAPNITNNLKS
ncbi:predicted protein [Arabidopsis lyrata subsp. lyrata]|uniref:Predicted protein n=1 Tax=Arabidopsis lyrata subsp. lyrata TaxID=81972 RepID=D7KY06_ARALL|nr:predicted protein [Arabidopsis lyrata subsp. lyrata]